MVLGWCGSPQVEEAQRRHDLLVEIIHKEQEHNRRLVNENNYKIDILNV